jgi:cation transport ATPase
MSLSAYEDLVHELTRLDADTNASTAQATRQLERRRESLREVRSELDDQMMGLAELCARLRHTTPDLTPVHAAEEEGAVEEGASPARQTNPDSVLERAKTALREAELARTATTRSAQRPTLLPKAHHVLRELLVYGSCMVACLAVQLVYFAATGGDDDSKWWVTFLLPVMATIIGYVLVGMANRPRLPLLDRSGKPIKAVVPHNPRLGVTLAVCTIAVVLLFAWF